MGALKKNGRKYTRKYIKGNSKNRSKNKHKKHPTKKAGARAKLKGRLTRHHRETTFGLERSRGAIRGIPPLPGETQDDLKIKDIEMKRDLLNNDPKFQMIFREFATLPYVNIPRKPYKECIKLYDKWAKSGKAADVPSETSFYIYKNNSQKLSHLEWSYNEYVQQNKED